jgi:hypothetical protein
VKLTYAQIAQAVTFVVVIIEFLAFSFGLVHVPVNVEDAKFFYLLFGAINTILCVPTLVQAIQKDDGFVQQSAPVVTPEVEPEVKPDEAAV